MLGERVGGVTVGWGVESGLMGLAWVERVAGLSVGWWVESGFTVYFGSRGLVD